ncbi:MAG: hypothetical protein ACFNVO_10740 [Prevotella sp.]
MAISFLRLHALKTVAVNMAMRERNNLQLRLAVRRLEDQHTLCANSIAAAGT